MAESLLLAVTRILTFAGDLPLTAGSGFFYEREGRLFLVTSRHVFLDADTHHHPDRITFTVHTDGQDLTRAAPVALPLYAEGRAAWRQAVDSGGEVDVATLPIAPADLPAGAVLARFTPAHLLQHDEAIGIGAALLIVGFPLGFYDTVHHLPVARQAVVASAFGIRFQGLGYFLTDARMHRGASGAPVVVRRATPDGLPWTLVGVHSSRVDMRSRDLVADESLGLNCAWYADVLRALTG